MGFIKSTLFGFVLLYAVGFAISQERTTETPITTSTVTTTTVIMTTTTTPETTVKPTVPPTTEPPSTTTVPATTTSKPPLPQLGSWNVTDGNVTCIRAELRVGFTINVKGEEASFALSPDASTLGSDCNGPNGTQVLQLTGKNYSLTFIFRNDSSSVYVQHLALAYRPRQGEEELFSNSSQLFKVKVGNSYLCRTTDSVSLVNATMEVYDIHLQAFGTANENDFTTVEECELDDKVSDIIPIAVACALAALIIIVLIAYLVGRRRSRQGGYTSV